MKKKDILFCLLVLAWVFFMRKSHNTIFSVQTDRVRLIRIGFELLTISGCCWLAVKYGLLRAGGFVYPNKGNYWMLLIPVLFPGMAFLPNADLSCFAFTFSVFVHVLTILIAALTEEIVFRGTIQGYLRVQNPGRSAHYIALRTAILFSLVHLTNLQYYEATGVAQQVIYAFFLGLLFSALQFRINNIWLLGITHGILNLITSNFCKEDTIVEEAGKSTLLDFLTAIAIPALILSPLLLIYWLLIKTYKPVNTPTTSCDNEQRV